MTAAIAPQHSVDPTMSTQLHHRVVIVGGGTGGITVAARLRRKMKGIDVAIIEPSDQHYYQPLWTLVGGGVFPKETTQRNEEAIIPTGVKWIQDAVMEFHPEENYVLTEQHKKVSYDYLVVAPGIQLNWGQVKGLTETIGQNGVCSNYAYEYVQTTWENIKNFKGGNALFTQPNTPIKCGGAPQKIMYLAEDYFRKVGVRDKSNVSFVSGMGGIFSVKKYADSLNTIVDKRGIQATYKHNLIEIRADAKESVFENLDTGEHVVRPYDMIHVTPPMGAPDFITHSRLANAGGWVDVDKHTLQHTRYPNIFSLGDASSLPTSKTGAAIRKQSPVLVDNMLTVMRDQTPHARYDGYSSCPLVTGYGRLILAEFDYDLQPQETFPFDQSKERYSMYLLKAYGLPQLYWNGMLKGRA